MKNTGEKQDIFLGKNGVIEVMTDRSGKFVFQIGVDLDALHPLLARVQDAQHRFAAVPMLPEISTKLEQEVLVSSVFGTNTIEGGTLTEQETAVILAQGGDVTEQKDRRVVNLKHVYDFIEGIADQVLENRPEPNMVTVIELKEFMPLDLHKKTTEGLVHPFNRPGAYRDNQKGQLTRVGTLEHGGVYVAPKCRADIEVLMKAFLEWANRPEVRFLNPLIRAPLVHYYFERIHPFWDGNGRVGRALEALVLKCSGFQYAPFALSRFYLEHMDEYFTVFNTARRVEEKKQPFPNTAFIQFFLERMLDALNRLHDRVNVLIGFLLYETRVHDLFHAKAINHRQHTIVFQLVDQAAWPSLIALQAEPWYRNLYKDRTKRTADRDLHKLVELKLIEITPEKTIKLVVPGG